MTLRDHINRKYRRFKIGFLSGFVVIIIGIVVMNMTQKDGVLLPFALAGFLISVFSAMLGNGFVKCPRCRKSIDEMIMFISRPWSLSLPSNIRFCRSCGASFDQELVENITQRTTASSLPRVRSETDA